MRCSSRVNRSESVRVHAEGTHSYCCASFELGRWRWSCSWHRDVEHFSCLARLLRKDLGGNFKYLGSNPALSHWATGCLYLSSTFLVTWFSHLWSRMMLLVKWKDELFQTKASIALIERENIPVGLFWDFIVLVIHSWIRCCFWYSVDDIHLCTK